MTLTARLDRIERRHAPRGNYRCFIVSKDGLEAKKAELRRAPFNPEDNLVFVVLTDNPNAELVRKIDD